MRHVKIALNKRTMKALVLVAIRHVRIAFFACEKKVEALSVLITHVRTPPHFDNNR